MPDERLTTARKEHTCTLCQDVIHIGERYIKQRITPCDHPDNEGFFTYRAHEACHRVWVRVGDQYDWRFPDDWDDWKQRMEEEARREQEVATHA